jgi:fatty-acid desaturase
MLAHNHFTVVPWFERLVVLMSPFALQGYPAGYVVVHLMHHKYADQEGDPHPPVSATRKRWVNLVFPFLHDSKELELKLIIKFMRRPAQKFITKYYWHMVALITVLFCIVNYKLLFIWLAGTQLGIFMGYMLNTYGHNPPDSKLYFWKHYRGDIDSTHKAVNLPGWSLQGRGENWHYVHHTYPNRWNFHPQAEQGKLDQNAWIIDKLVKLGIAEVKTPA